MIARLASNDVLLHAAIVFGGVVVNNVFSYLFYMLIGRRAGVVVYGEVASLVSVLLVVGAPAIVGQLVVARLAAALHAAGQSDGLKRLADLVTLGSAGVGLVVLAAVLVASEPIARFFALQDARAIVADGAALAAFVVVYVQRGVLQGAHHFAAFSGSLSLEAVAKVALGLWLVGPFGTTGAVAGVAAALVLVIFCNLICFRRLFGRRGGAIALERATLARTAGGVGLGQLTMTVLAFYDVPIVKHAFDPRSAGLYAAAALVGRAVLGASGFVPTIVLPKAAARAAAGRSTLPLLFAAAALAGAIALAAALAAAIAPRLVVTTIAGRAFGEAAPLVLPYVVAAGALSIATVIASYNFGLHRYAFVVPAFAIAAVEVIVLSLYHPTPAVTIGILAAGHVAVLAATCVGTREPVPPVATTLEAAEEEAAALAAAEPIG